MAISSPATNNASRALIAVTRICWLLTLPIGFFGVGSTLDPTSEIDGLAVILMILAMIPGIALSIRHLGSAWRIVLITPLVGTGLGIALADLAQFAAQPDLYGSQLIRTLFSVGGCGLFWVLGLVWLSRSSGSSALPSEPVN